MLAVQSSDLRDADSVARLLAALRTADPAVCELAGRSITNYGGWFGLTAEDPTGAPMPMPMLEAVKDERSPLVRRAVRWAIARIDDRD